MGCFKAVVDKLKKDVKRKMGNMPTLRINDKFERMSEERSSKKSFSDLMLPDWMEDPRVPMDFTEGIGRIVHDAEEIEKIRREPKQTGRFERFEKYERFPKTALEHGRHLTQKYYHGGITRQEAEILLREVNKNGAWMLRDSRARTYCLTISYLYEDRIYHKYVSAASYKDPSSGKRIYVATLDQLLAFYDVHSLTEFYRLNKGDTMMCMLGISVKNESQRDSSPERSISHPVPNPPVPINLNVRDNRSPQSIHSSSSSNKSSKSLKDFFSKSIQKSKGALKPKKLATGDECQGPSTSKEPGPSAAPAEQEEPLESPPSPSQEVSSSGISSNGAQTTPESPPPLLSEDHLTLQQPSDPPSSSKTPQV